jgi:hypothetical protein
MGGWLEAKCMAEEQHNNWNGKDADRADDVANNVSDAHGVFSFVCLLVDYLYTSTQELQQKNTC